MPYIEKSRRKRLDSNDRRVPTTAGELNYVLTCKVLKFLGDDPDYAAFNEVVGVLESVKLEFFRRAVAPYEDEKAFRNGDVGYMKMKTDRMTKRFAAINAAKVDAAKRCRCGKTDCWWMKTNRDNWAA